MRVSRIWVTGDADSRPHVSNDNPYSDAQFKTMKYRLDVPERIGPLEDARAHGTHFFTWYNSAHRHSILGLHTPAVISTHPVSQTR